MKNKYQKRVGIIFLCTIFILFSIIGINFSADGDYDGLDDVDEMNLLNKHAPKLIFHPEENERPRTVESLFYEYNHDLVSKRIDYRLKIIPSLDFPFFRIDKVEVVKEEMMIKSDIKLSDLSKYSEESGKGWKLMLARRGKKNNFISSLPYTIYGHCFKTKDSFGTEYIELQYWIFYANNIIRDLPDVWVEDTNLKRALHIDHEGDWEFVAIRLSKDYPYEPQQIYYSAHYPINWTEDQIRSWENVTKYDNTHPIVYVARDSHANYYSSGDHKSDIQYIGYEYTDRTGYGETTIPNVINLGEKNASLNNCDWIKYSGLWGEDPGSPKGPVYRDTGGIGSWDGMFHDNPGDIRNWVFFYSLQHKNVKIKIFTIDGELVREVDEGYKEPGKEYTYIWDGKNNNGETCASGIYLYVVLLNDQKIKEGKLAWVHSSDIIPLVRYSIGNVRIYLYTIGDPPELVRTLDEGMKTSGNHVAVWDAKNDAGEKVAYQVYIYLIKVDDIKIEEGKIIPAYLRPYIYDVSVSANSFSIIVQRNWTSFGADLR